ncbi:MAG TPA: NTP transferase domain-containing protein [Trueperaceae bacterium]|nr:NTP transferase domain-containing protein [Trueperaceae bacterium]
MPGPATLAAIVLAGGSATDALAVGGAVPTKALLPIGGEPMAVYVLAAVRDTPRIDMTVLVGPQHASLTGWYDVSVPGGTRLVDSLSLGLGAALAGGAEEFLIITADVPWVDGPMLTRFLDGATAQEFASADLVYGVVEKATATAAFPAQRRTFVRLRDGRFTGGNAVYMKRAAIGGLLPLIDDLYRARKNPFALAGKMGIDTLFALATGTATISQLERRARRLLGVEARALISSDAAIAADVDRPAHVPGAGDGRLPAPPKAHALRATRRAS